MEWVPIVFLTFKLVVLCIGMFLAIKWHYDQGKKKNKMDREKETRAVLRAGGKVIVIFVLSLLCLGLATFVVVRMLGLDLSLP